MKSINSLPNHCCRQFCHSKRCCLSLHKSFYWYSCAFIVPSCVASDMPLFSRLAYGATEKGGESKDRSRSVCHSDPNCLIYKHNGSGQVRSFCPSNMVPCKMCMSPELSMTSAELSESETFSAPSGAFTDKEGITSKFESTSPAETQKEPVTYVTVDKDPFYHKDINCSHMLEGRKRIHVESTPKDVLPCLRCTSMQFNDLDDSDAKTIASALMLKEKAETRLSSSDISEDTSPYEKKKEKMAKTPSHQSDMSLATFSPVTPSTEGLHEYDKNKSPPVGSHLTAAQNDDSCSKLDPYIETRTGRFFHMDAGCDNLRNAKRLFRVAKPKPELLPCYLCAEHEQQSVETSRTTNSEISRSLAPLSVAKSVPDKPFVVTRTGRFYHFDRDCKNLQTARRLFQVENPDAKLLPCYICVEQKTDGSANTPVVSSSSSRKECHALPSPDGRADTRTRGHRSDDKEFITTRTGRFFHLDDDCYNLRSATRLIRVSQPASHLKACYLCADHLTWKQKAAYGFWKSMHTLFKCSNSGSNWDAAYQISYQPDCYCQWYQVLVSFESDFQITVFLQLR